MRATLDITSDEFVLICIARLSETKGVDILLQALAKVMQDGIDFKCFVLGDGPTKQTLLTQAHSLGLSDRVRFKGFQPDVAPYLQAASAFVLTSYMEGLPLSALEAMACGLPCIVTDVGGSAEAVTDRVCGLVIPPGSVDEAARAIAFLATHPPERATMSRMARKRACTTFDIEVTMKQLISLLLS